MDVNYVIKVGDTIKHKTNGRVYTISKIDGNRIYADGPNGNELFGFMSDYGTPNGWAQHWDLVSSKDSSTITVKASSVVGCFCLLCKDYAEYASPNRADGKTFICFSCRKGWIPKGL